MKRVNDRFMIDLFQDFISAIPLSMWNEKLLIPAEQCVDNGFSCIQTSYPDPSDATKIEVEDRSTGGDIAPYYIMDRRARLKHVKVGKVWKYPALNPHSTLLFRKLFSIVSSIIW